GRVEQPFLDVGFCDAPNRVAHLLRDELRGVGIDHVGDLHHLTLLHQQADDVDGALGHSVGEFLDGDGLRDRHLADELLLGLIGDLALEPLHAAAERGVRALALLVLFERGDQGEAAAALLGPGAGRLGGGRGTRGTGTATRGSRRFFLLGLERCRARAGGGALFLLAEALLGFQLGLALGFLVVAAAILLLALARLGGLALDLFAALAVGAAPRLVLGDTAFLGFAYPRVGEGMGAGAALLVGEGA